MNRQSNTYKPLHITLQAAQAAGLTTEALDALTQLAALLIARHHKEEAAALLAYVLQHGAAYRQIYSHAEDLWLDLETELCPRVLWDARAQAQTLTWETFMGELLDGDIWSLD